MRAGKVAAAWTPGYGGISEAILKMCFGNMLGFRFEDALPLELLFGYRYGAFVLELTDNSDVGVLLGTTTNDGSIKYGDAACPLNRLLGMYEDKLESVFPCKVSEKSKAAPNLTFESGTQHRSPALKTAKPRVIIPVFPGTNCEFDSARAMREAGADAEIFVINNLTADGVARSVEAFAQKVAGAQMIFIPGGFSGGDEPDGSGKFITAFFRSGAVKASVEALLEKAGRSDLRYLQRISGADQAGTRSFWENRRYGRKLSYPDLQYHWTPPIAHRAYAHRLQHVTVAQRNARRRCVSRPGFARRRPFPGQRLDDRKACRKRANRNAVCRSKRQRDYGYPL